MVEDRPLQILDGLGRLDTELLDERLSQALVCLERAGLAPCSVEREHQLRVQALAKRLIADQRLELADDLEMATEQQVGLDSRFECHEAQLFEPRCGRGGKRCVPELRERLAAP